MESLATLWRDRTEREQRLLAVMLALVLVVLGWLLVVRPLSDRLDEAQRRHGAALVAVAEQRAAIEARRSLDNRPRPALSGPVDAIVVRLANEAGFGGARIQGRGPMRASVAIDAARPQAFFAWVARLEQSGLVVERLRARANNDRTLTAELAVRARSGR